MSGPLRIGILGAARITGGALVEPARETGDRLVAVAARDRSRAEAFAAEHGVERVVGSYADVLADPEVEIVYNPLANALHGPWNLAAVEAGKHVLSEKPFAGNAAEAREVRDAAAAAGVVVLEAFHHVHHPVLRRLHELVASGELGALRRVEARFTMPAPPDDDPRWRLDLAGGALMDLGCYPLRCLRSFAERVGGEPSVVSATADERAGHPGVDERVTAQLAFPSGATGEAHCDMASDDWSITCRVVGEDGEATAMNVVLPQRDDRIVVHGPDGERTEHLGTRSTYLYQLEAVRAHLHDGAPFPAGADDAVATAELIDAVYTAAGLPVRPSMSR
ncbi:Gfo/Idh/MocA family protein [Pseudonocardia abyssalis]|uniref:Gfo/Idh/MocA family oxidoreductase n=1 Tax=Pseudonocardia abyssalis TaxID=2792008 RepID=A0ABS6UP73_9PSEU|nr:Gfo/Idh/MocA family oxidoreductase [Pseudonocardia abyssalis]MBW0116238.1 Gfo/Idh/MocA family oxidoreductase [Pseudonocardia abyssalis]MBW0134058.1 Gfo/Idh/MocA family oxidoreductase [Pseudonocardia abyssalis]